MFNVKRKSDGELFNVYTAQYSEMYGTTKFLLYSKERDWFWDYADNYEPA